MTQFSISLQSFLISIFSDIQKILKMFNSRTLVIGDSHLCRLDPLNFNTHVVVDAVPGRKACSIPNSIFDQDYDFILAIGGNDINYHKYENATPKTPAETADKLISGQLHGKEYVIVTSERQPKAFFGFKLVLNLRLQLSRHFV